MAFATVSADLLGMSVSNVNLVRSSMMERTILHLTPAAEIDSDLYSTKSTEILRNGRCTGERPVGNFGLL